MLLKTEYHLLATTAPISPVVHPLRPGVFSARRRAMLAWLALCVGLLCGSEALAAPLRVVTVLTDHAWLTKQIGGKRVQVTALLTGREDPHHVSARPSLILKMSRAQLFVSPGMELDVGYTPLLLRSSRNGQIQIGAKGYVNASIYVQKRQVPVTVNRGMGDIHTLGNPHYHLDPVAMIASARAIAEGLIRIDSSGQKQYKAGLKRVRKLLITRLVGRLLVSAAGLKKLERLLKNNALLPFLRKTRIGGKPLLRYLGGWLKQGLALRGKKAITYHRQWIYFFDRFGLVSIGQMEPKPGIPPTAQHLAFMIKKGQSEKPRWVISANYYAAGSARYLSKKLKVKMLQLPFHTGGHKQASTYPALIDHMLKQLRSK